MFQVFENSTNSWISLQFETIPFSGQNSNVSLEAKYDDKTKSVDKTQIALLPLVKFNSYLGHNQSDLSIQIITQNYNWKHLPIIFAVTTNVFNA